VLIEPISKFLEDTFGLIWPPSEEEREAADEFRIRWSRLRDLCRDNGGSLLTAVGLADGELVPDEVGAILDFVQQCCAIEARGRRKRRRSIAALHPTTSAEHGSD